MRIRPILAALPLLVLAACGSETANNSSVDPSESAAATETAATSAESSESDAAGTDAATSAEAPAEGAASAAVADPPADPATMPTVEGGFGETPAVSFPANEPPATLERQVLVEGDGPVVAAGDLLAANYSGQVWGSDTTFDSSFERGAPVGFGIGINQVVNGWDVGLVGMKVGSRVLLTLPPADGYGAGGNAQAGIEGTDTLVFVVDIVGTYSPDGGGQADAAIVGEAPAGITIDGDLGSKPTVTISDDFTAPKEPLFVLLAEGTGDKLEVGKTAAVQYVAEPFADEEGGASWGSAPETLTVSDNEQSSFKDVVGVPVGSRVLVVVPETVADEATGATDSPAVAFVLDIVGQF